MEDRTARTLERAHPFVGVDTPHQDVAQRRGFGAPGYFRISYCVDDKVIEGALPRFRKAAEEFGLG